MQVRKKLIIIFSVLFALLSLECPETPVPPSEKAEYVTIDPIYDANCDQYSNPVSATNSCVQFAWKKSSSQTSANVTLSLYNSSKLTLGDIGIPFSLSWNVQASVPGNGQFYWDGRVIAASNNKRIPVPTGSYYLRLYFAQLLSEYTKIQVEANTWDRDGDDLSDGVEDENYLNPITITYPSSSAGTYTNWYDSYNVDLPPRMDANVPASDDMYPNRGTHDYSISKGAPGNGSLLNGLRYANAGTGYYDKNEVDPSTSDIGNYATLTLVNVAEQVGRQWYVHHSGGPRMGLGDMSRQGGGSFLPEHVTHQNGTDLDVRYVRTTAVDWYGQTTFEAPLDLQQDYNTTPPPSELR